MKPSSVSGAVGCVAALIVALAPPAGADPPAPPDPHLPDITKNFCPGGHWSDNVGSFGYGATIAVCDGERYPDGSFWHQWADNGYVGIGVTYHYDCVSGNNIMPAPPPPGGCDGAIPAEPPPG